MHDGLTTTAVPLTGAVAAGVALGFGTQILQGSLRASSAVLANSGAMWIIVAFGLGLMMSSSRTAAIGGAIALVAASVSYYVAVLWFEGISSTPHGAVIWSIAGIVAGSSFGFAGFLARHHNRLRYSAWALLAGAVIGEGIHLTWFVGNANLRPAGIAELAVAAIIGIVFLRRARPATLVMAITAAAALITLLAGTIINRVFTAA